jgi:molybdate/tungstate transport system substrate-binding protein
LPGARGRRATPPMNEGTEMVRARRIGGAFRPRSLFTWLLLVACSGGTGRETIVVYSAGSLGRPLRAALDSFTIVSGVHGQLETAGSLETARKLTELGKTPDVVALADEDVFPNFLMPRFVHWYARFGTNELVLAYNPRSRFAATLDSTRWWVALLRDGVATGRADANLDPSGYRTLMVFQLAEHHYGVPGLAARLAAAAPPRFMRPNEADLVGLLQAGELDFAWQYRSLASSAGLPYLTLPPEINLGSPDDSAFYATAAVRVLGAALGDTIVARGRPIVYGISIPLAAPNAAAARRFVAWLLSSDGARVLRREDFESLSVPALVGTDVPALLRANGAATPR